jgi:ABC-type Zn uptake system ZnuABC Zn-binding protein ZnuA
MFFCALLVFLGLVLDFVSAPAYGTLQLFIVICDLTAIFCLQRLNGAGTAQKYVSGLLAVIATFTVVDVFLRKIAGVRVFDVFV